MIGQRSRREVVHAIETTGVVAVIRLADATSVRAVADALAAGGVTAIEVTMTVPNAVELIAELARSVPEGVTIGAGTVTTAETARQVIRAGAVFVVSPVFKPEVVEVCRREDIAVMPGCFTPTEILAAWESGADIVKVFPATALGPQFIKDVRAPLPQVRLMPTGGVSIENAGAWIRAGAVALGVGTALVDAASLAARKFDVITARATEFVAAVQQARVPEAGR